MPGKWERRDIAHTAEVCKALVRIPVIKHAQIAQLVGIRKEQSFRLVRHAYNALERREYIPGTHTSSRYSGSHGLSYYVRLTRDGAREWGEREGIQPRMMIRSRDLVRYIATMDVLIALRQADLLYDEWDIRLPQEEAQPFHAVLTHKQSGYGLGLFLLPQKFVGEQARQKLNVLHGIIRKVDQKSGVNGVLYLIPREYYRDALRMMLKLALKNDTSYLVPLESFLEKPRYYLWAIRHGENWYMEQLEKVITPRDQMPLPVKYQDQYQGLWKLDERLYRLAATYVSGDIGRLRSWITGSQVGFQVPETGSIAAGSVYVFDRTTHEAIEAIMKNRRGALWHTEFHPWPICDDEK